MRFRLLVPLFLIPILTSGLITANGQTFPTDDPVIKSMWDLGINHSQTKELAHVLLDRIGPRLAGSPNLAEAQDWLMDTYSTWGVDVQKEEYGTWNGWQQGVLHVDLLSPRLRTLDARMLAWSPSTDGPVEAEVIMPPEGLSKESAREWLHNVRGKFVMMSAPEAMCRAPQELKEYARPETVARLDSARFASFRNWEQRMAPIGGRRARDTVVDSAGAAGLLTSRWSRGWGVNKVFSTSSKRAVAIDISCEDYGLLYRLLEYGGSPRIRVEATSRTLGVVPQFNVIARLQGSERPNEYVLLGAHLDSWHAASGATDNGTGTITMLEAMRILKNTYPNPKRTIIVGHWGDEEMGAIGSNAFREDHPDVVDGLQVAFNQDNGTWRFEKIEGQGVIGAAPNLARWVSALPSSFSEHIALVLPGPQDNRGSDHISFLCAGAPSFRLQSPYDEYRQYTWHTNRDTYDKIVFEDLRENATVAAMLAYMASEDPEHTGRERAVLPVDPRTSQPRNWVKCRPARREPR